MDTSVILQVLINGILLGSVYAMITSGLDVIYGVMEMINFAHGEFVMLGMYVTYWLSVLYGIDPFISLAIAPLICFAVGVIFERAVIKRVLGAPIFIQTFATFGLLILLQNIALFVWGEDFRAIGKSYGNLWLGNLSFDIARVISAIGSITMLGMLYLFLSKTKLGIALRATSENREVAKLMGVNVSYMFALAFGIGTLCAGIAGVFLSTFYYIYPTVGSVFILMAFVICVLGGMGNLLGALIGGLLIGEVEAVSAFLVGSQWRLVIAMIIFVIILLVRPSGLLGERRR
jgi:branched-chain amino acid transport system permease protein